MNQARTLPVQLSYLEQDAPGATLLEMYIGTNEPLAFLCPFCFAHDVALALAHLTSGDQHVTEADLTLQLRKHTYNHLGRRGRRPRLRLMDRLIQEQREAGNLS